MQLLLIEERKKGLLGLVINFRPSLPFSNAPPFNSREEGLKICIGGMLPLKTLLLFFPLSPLLPPFSAPKKERERGVRSFPCQHMGAPKKKGGRKDGREFLPFLQIRGYFRSRSSRKNREKKADISFSGGDKKCAKLRVVGGGGGRHFCQNRPSAKDFSRWRGAKRFFGSTPPPTFPLSREIFRIRPRHAISHTERETEEKEKKRKYNPQLLHFGCCGRKRAEKKPFPRFLPHTHNDGIRR